MADHGNVANRLTTFVYASSAEIRIGSPRIGPSPWSNLHQNIVLPGIFASAPIRTGVTGAEGYFAARLYPSPSTRIQCIDRASAAPSPAPTPVTKVTWG